ncbi:hypothetical protein SAMN02910357_00463 [Succinivibrio dextrinosolvens]|uniref:hypothetical protein n=1 Tax=Succinivibrio dextrinosolvens TaxID=83771 RepID=UPI0008E18183|nr:hypothetical protein [Succinivibrio dextrinosolvens]SFS38618.1 hypothetical protein SAMN02910357_00463 [Succinivibrio dextrinosolvens]
MADNRQFETENYEEISSDNRELLNRIRTLTRENRELKRQLEESEPGTQGDQKMQLHRYGQNCSGRGEMRKGRCHCKGQGHGCSKHSKELQTHDLKRGNCRHSGISNCNEHEKCCKSGVNNHFNSCSEHVHHKGGCCCHR